MQRCVAFPILNIDVGVPREDVRNGRLGLRVAGPVQRGAPPLILGVNVEALRHEKEERERCVTLGGHVKHVQAVVVDDVEARLVFDERVDGVDVALERGIVESGPPLTLGFGVQPPVEYGLIK